ncbi:MAG: YraN family protein [Minisyncoccia bacterium]|jgi:putative endonuclease
MKTKLKGFIGEKIAENFLIKKGYKILAKNLKLKNLGEIDILCEKENKLNFVEVKTLFENKNFLPEFHFNFKKRKRIERLANFFCLKFKKEDYFISLIAIEVKNDKIKIRYYENV